MSFKFWQSYYDSYVGLEIRGSIGNKYTYRFSKGFQYKYKYTVPYDPKTLEQLRIRDLFRKSVDAWHNLTLSEQKYYKKLYIKKPTMSGFNFFVGNYIKTYI